MEQIEMLCRAGETRADPVFHFVSANRLELRSNRWHVAMSWLMVGVGVLGILAAIAFATGIIPVVDRTKWVVIAGLVGVICPYIVLPSLRIAARPFVFDRSEGFVQKGEISKDLKSIEAIQLLSGEISPIPNHSMVVHELNLVFLDGSRVHLVSGKTAESCREPAEKLSEFLGVPIRDGAESR